MFFFLFEKYHKNHFKKCLKNNTQDSNVCFNTNQSVETCLSMNHELIIRALYENMQPLLTYISFWEALQSLIPT